MPGNRVALITGGSRGIGAATALSLALRGFDVAITYRNKAARAQSVAQGVEALGCRCLVFGADIIKDEDIRTLTDALQTWAGRLDLLVLNASGGLERELVAADPEYPMRINRDAQLAVVDATLPLMPQGSTIVFVTSHWAHLYGQVEQLPSYDPVARTKFAGEEALRRRQEELSNVGIRLLVVTGDLVGGTITPKLLDRAGRGTTSDRQARIGRLPSTEDMGEAIAQAASDPSLPAGHTLVIGGALDTLPRM